MPPSRAPSGSTQIRNTKFKPPSFTNSRSSSGGISKPTKSTSKRPSMNKGKKPAGRNPADMLQLPGSDSDDVVEHLSSSNDERDSSDEDLDDEDESEISTTHHKQAKPSTSATVAARRTNETGNPKPTSALLGDSHAPAIPPKLLTRMLHDGFEDPNTRIGKEAMSVVGMYFETFVREALARAAAERRAAPNQGGIGDDFLQVEDLEKLAPQLLLDF